MDLNLDTIKALMKLMNEEKISTLRFGDLVLQKSQFVTKPSNTDILDRHVAEDNLAKDLSEEEKQRIEDWSQSGMLPIPQLKVPNLKRK